MVFENDKTILTNPHQTDYWSTTHILIPWFCMLWGFPWYAPLLGVYIWKAVESLPWIDYATLTDALIVDPVETIFGILAFVLLEDVGYAVKAYEFPWRYSQFWDWLLTGWLWVPTVLTTILIDVFNAFSYDWLYVFTFGLMAIFTVLKQKTFAQKVCVFLYPVTLSILISALNTIPYSGWYTALWFHIMFIPLLFLYVVKIFRVWMDEKPERVGAFKSEEEKDTFLWSDRLSISSFTI